MRLSKEALKKYADGTTYRAGGKTYKRVSFAGTKRGDNYCARSSGQKQTEKVKVRRKAWGCRGKKSIAGIGNPCWSGYEQFGMKTKGGRRVPNCVKITGLGAVDDKFVIKNLGFGDYEVTGNYKGKKAFIEITKQDNNTYVYRSYLSDSFKNEDFNVRLKDIKELYNTENGRKWLFGRD